MFEFKKYAESELERERALLKMLPERIEEQDGCVKVYKGKRVTSFRLYTSKLDDDGNQVVSSEYIGNADSDAVKKIKADYYLKELRKRLERNVVVLEKMLKRYQEFDMAAINNSLSCGLGEVQFEGIPGFYSSKDQLAKWANQEYETNRLEMERIHVSISGRRFRSKSEVIIANILDAYRVPYRTEEKIILRTEDGFKIAKYPDFTIKTSRGAKLYWEHFGVLGSMEYSDNVAEKLRLYAMNGILPGRNLIISAESSQGEINAADIIRLINAFVLKQL